MNVGTGFNSVQMSDAWINKVAKIIEENDQDLYDKIIAAKESGLLRKTVSAVKNTNPGNGSIITIKVNKYGI